MSEYKCSCLCGANQFSVVFDTPPHAQICHCGKCRKWTGGPFMAVDLFDPSAASVMDKVKFSAGPALTSFASSEWGKREFCSCCGTSLFWRDNDNSFCAINLYCLEQANDIAFEKQIFIDDKPAHYCMAGDIPSMTGEEVFALFSAGS
jgi:hypothetical protein